MRIFFIHLSVILQALSSHKMIYMKEKYSGKDVIRAGEVLLNGYEESGAVKFYEAMDILSYWRFRHEAPLEAGLSLLKSEAIKIDRSVIFAKRLKRYPSILSKLERFPKMKLKNMQDIGGCRGIVSNQKKLDQIVRELRNKTEFKNSNGDFRFKDYIKKPKDDGYRGYHLIGSFKDQFGKNKLIELQLRTRIQHDWATALEIVDLFTGQALKSNRGEEGWADFFSLVGRHFSVMEEIHLFNRKTPEEQLSQYQKKVSMDPLLSQSGEKISSYESSLKVVKKLEAFSHTLRIADKHISEKKASGYVLLKIDMKNSNLQTVTFNENENSDAEEQYLQSEKKASGNDDIVIALVSTTAVGGIKEAYPNYFADSSEFLKYLIHILNVHNVKKPNFLERALSKSGL